MFSGLPEQIVASDLTIRIRPKAELMPPFLASYLSFLHVTGYWKARAGGASGSMKKITRAQVEAEEIPVPPLGEQRRIVAQLGQEMAAAGRARAAAAARLQAARDLPASYLRAVFDRPEAHRWPRRALEPCADIVGGIQKTPGRAPFRLHRPYLTVRNVQRGYLDLSEVERFEITEAELERVRLQTGDILIVEGNGSRDHIGRNALFVGDGQEWIHQNHIIRVRLDRALAMPKFVSGFLNSQQGRAQMLAKAETTSGLYTLSTGKVGSLEIPLPPLAEQERVSAMLEAQMSEAERVRNAAEDQVALVNAMPAALLRRAFSGAL